MAAKTTTSQSVPFLALLLGWLVPGAGHFYLGRRVRGVIIFIVITTTFWSGIAVGGTLAVDRRTEIWWFYADLCGGVNGLIGWHCQNRYYRQLDADIDKAISENPQYKDIARSSTGQYEALRQELAQKIQARDNMWLQPPNDTVGRGFCGVAGLLNLICAFDALMLSLMGVYGEKTPLQKTRAQEAVK